MDEKIEVLRDDMREIKESLKLIQSTLNDFSTRFVANEKDLEVMVKEFIRINAEAKTGDDYLWNAVRLNENKCEGHREKCKKEMDERIKELVTAGNKDIKLWIAFSVITGLMGTGALFLRC